MAPEQDAGSSYNYTIDEENNKIIISNCKTVDAGSQFTMSAVYRYDYEYKYDSKAFPQYAYLDGVLKLLDDYDMSIPVVIDIEDEIVTKRTCTLSVDTATEIATDGWGLSGNSDMVSESYDDENWSASFKPANSDEYIYHEFYMYQYKGFSSFSQDANISVSISVDNENIIPLGFVTNFNGGGQTTTNPLVYRNGDTFTFKNDISVHDTSSYYSVFFVLAINKSALQSSGNLDGRLSVELHIQNVDDKKTFDIVKEKDIEYAWPTDDANGYVLSTGKGTNTGYDPGNYDYFLANGIAAKTSWQPSYNFSNPYENEVHTIEIIDDRMFLSDAAGASSTSATVVQLDENDYSIYRSYVARTIEFQKPVVNYLTGGVRYEDVNVPEGTSVSFFIKNSVGGTWQEVGTFEVDTSKNRLGAFIPNNLGNTLGITPTETNGGIDLSAVNGVTGIKLKITTTGSLYMSQWTGDAKYGIYTKINPTEKVQKFLNSDYDRKRIYNFTTMAVYDSEGTFVGYTQEQKSGTSVGEAFKQFFADDIDTYGTEMAHASAYKDIHYSKHNAYGNKKISSIKDYSDDSYVEIKYQVFPYFTFSSHTGAFELTDDEIAVLYEHDALPSKSYYIYDLLPRGASLIADKIDADLSLISVQNNYKGTGRTLVTFLANPEEKDTGACATTSYDYQYYSIRYDYSSIVDYGSELHNSVAFEPVCGGYGEKGRADDGGDIKDAEILADIDGDGTQEEGTRFLYAECDTTLVVPASAEVSLTKSVMSSASNGWVNATSAQPAPVAPNEQYQYRIRFGTLPDTTTSNMIVYDNIEQSTFDDLPSDETFSGILQSVDVSHPTSYGIKPLVYYSTQSGIDFSTHGIDADPSIWTTTMPSDKSTIRAVAIDMRKMSDGSPASISDGQTISIILNMQAPPISSDEMMGLHSYNDATLHASISDSVGGSVPAELIEYQYTDAQIDAAKLTVSKDVTGHTDVTDYTFTLRDSNGNPVRNDDKHIDGLSANGTFELADGESITLYVPSGTYTVTEENVDDMQADNELESVSSTVGDSQPHDGAESDDIVLNIADEQVVSFKNEFAGADVRLSKVNAADGKPLQGAEFSVTGPKSMSKTLTSGSDGHTETMEGLTPGTYHVTETKRPSGTANTGSLEFDFTVTDDNTVTVTDGMDIDNDADSGIATITVPNHKNRLIVSKTLNGEAPSDDFDASGIEFTLTSQDRSTQKLVTDKSGTASLDNVELGTYKLAETKTLDGYASDGTVYTVTVGSDGVISVRDADDGDVSQSVSDGVLVTTLSVNNDGIPAISLEKSADEGASIPAADAVAGKVLHYSFTVTNTGHVDLRDIELTDALTADESLDWSGHPDKVLSPGESVRGTATYALTQDDIDSGRPLVNSASVTGTSTRTSDEVGDDTSTSTAIGQEPGISIDKTVDAESLSGADAVSGKTLRYSFEVRNTGNVTLSDIAITDSLSDSGLSEVSFDWDNSSSDATGDGKLAPGETVTATAAYTITQGDVDAGKVKNTASVSGKTPSDDDVSSGDDAVETTIERAPSVSIEKNVDKKSLGADESVVGTVLTYSFTITNTGNVTIDGIEMTDEMLGLKGACEGVLKWNESSDKGTGTGTLAPGESVSGTATYKLTQADIDAGKPITNTASVTGSSPDGNKPSDEDTTETIFTATPSISIEKSCDADSVTGDDAEAGTVIRYSFVIVNDGNVTLSDVAIDDALTGNGLSDIDYAWDGSTDDATGDGILSPGESVTASASYALKQSDVDSGQISNSATADATAPDGTDIKSEQSIVTTPIARRPSVSLDKSVDKTALSDEESVSGTVIEYSFVIKNDGNVTLDGIEMTDEMLGLNGTCETALKWDETSDDTTGVGRLAPGESVSGTMRYTVTQDDIDAGRIVNTASVTSRSPDGGTPSSTDSTETTASGVPSLALKKTVDKTALTVGGDDAPAKSGTKLTYEFKISNTGAVTLDDVSISDELKGLSDISYEWPSDVAGRLRPGETASATATYTVSQGDIDTGNVTNVAKATAENPGGDDVESTSEQATTSIERLPSLSVEKTTDIDGNRLKNPSAGDEIAYRIEVGNTGNVTLGSVNIEDALDGLGDLEFDWSGASQQGMLLPGETVTATARYTLTQSDIDSGSVTNSASASADAPDGSKPSGDSSVTTSIDADAHLHLALDVDKKSLEGDAAKAGTELEYTFVITNDGYRTLDAVDATSSIKDLSDIAFDGDATLGPGESVRGTAKYVIKQSDIDAGSVTLVSTATGVDKDNAPVVSNECDVRTEIKAAPGLSLEKTAETSVISGDAVEPGTTSRWFLTVANTGNVTISDISVEEDLEDADDIDYGDWNRTLAPGASHTLEVTYEITQSDIDAGEITNVARAVGTPASAGQDDVTSDDATSTVGIDADASLMVEKKADTDALSGEKSVPGTAISYEIKVTNTGDETLSEVAVIERLEGTSDIDLGNFDGTLAPGESITGTVAYEITQDDIDAGSVMNTATATARNTRGEEIDGNESTVLVSIEQAPALAFEKTADVDAIESAEPGDVITYSLLLSNTGNVTLGNATISDELDGISSIDYDWSGCAEQGFLKPGETLTGTATYAVTAGDIDAGSVTNVAVGTASTSAADSVKSQNAEAYVSLTAARQEELPRQPEEIVESIIQTGRDSHIMLAVAAAIGIVMILVRSVRRNRH